MKTILASENKNYKRQETSTFVIIQIRDESNRIGVVVVTPQRDIFFFSQFPPLHMLQKNLPNIIHYKRLR